MAWFCGLRPNHSDWFLSAHSWKMFEQYNNPFLLLIFTLEISLVFIWNNSIYSRTIHSWRRGTALPSSNTFFRACSYFQLPLELNLAHWTIPTNNLTGPMRLEGGSLSSYILFASFARLQLSFYSFNFYIFNFLCFEGISVVHIISLDVKC